MATNTDDSAGPHGRGHCRLCPDLRQLSAAELLALFAFTSSARSTPPASSKTLIWQGTRRSADGPAPADRRQPARSFCVHRHQASAVAPCGPRGGRRATELVYDAFVELVTQPPPVPYRDLGFLDEGAQTRCVADNGTCILFAERTALCPRARHSPGLGRDCACTGRLSVELGHGVPRACTCSTRLVLAERPALHRCFRFRLRPVRLLDCARVRCAAPCLRRRGGHTAPPHSSGDSHDSAGRPGPVHAPKGSKTPTGCERLGD